MLVNQQQYDVVWRTLLNIRSNGNSITRRCSSRLYVHHYIDCNHEVAWILPKTSTSYVMQSSVGRTQYSINDYHIRRNSIQPSSVRGKNWTMKLQRTTALWFELTEEDYQKEDQKIWFIDNRLFPWSPRGRITLDYHMIWHQPIDLQITKETTQLNSTHRVITDVV